MPGSGYTAITFIANEQPTTAKWNLIGSNFESLVDGSGFDDDFIVTRHILDGEVTAPKLDEDAIGHGFLEIGRTTLGSAGDSIVVSGLAAYRYLEIWINTIAQGGVLDSNFTLNNDSGNNYNFTYQTTLNGAETGSVAVSSIPIESGQTDSGQQASTIIRINGNNASEEKLFWYDNLSLDAAGAATKSSYLRGYGKWANTSNAINSIEVNNAGAGNFDVGSQVIVFGKN